MKKRKSKLEKNDLQNDELSLVIVPRVSTEAQAERGRSLEVQTKAMGEAAIRFGGEIVANYGGQEHATPDFEHTKMEELVAESYLPFGKRKWNAIMFYDNSRFSRDNRKASDYIEIFKRNKIRFFTICQEWNLYEPDHIRSLSLDTITGQHQAMKGTQKSMESRIEGARQGCFTAGQPPFGRRLKDGKLYIIKKKKERIETAAKYYLKEGLGVIKIAKILKMNASVLQRAFKHAGDTYVQSFKHEGLDINESWPTKIPPLLSAEIVKLIEVESAKRRKYHPGVVNSERPLCSNLFCYSCNRRYTVQEQTTLNKKNGNSYAHIYYRHPPAKCDSSDGKHKSFSIKGELLEELVIGSICRILNDSKEFKKALLNPHPTEDEKKSLEKELRVLRDSLEKVERKRINLLNKMENDKIKMEGLQERIDKRREDKNDIAKRVEEIENDLSNCPSEEEIESYQKLLIEKTKKLDLNNLTLKQKKELVEMFCSGGRVGEGKRQAGVYVWRNEENEDGVEFSFCIISMLGTVLGYLDEYPATMIDHKEDVNVEELRLHPSMNSFKAYTGTNDFPYKPYISKKVPFRVEGIIPQKNKQAKIVYH